MSQIKIEPYAVKDSVVLSKLKLTYSQEQDSNSDKSIDQFLKLWIEDAGSGNYFIMKTKRWAFDDIDDLINVLKDFKSRVTNAT